MFNLPPFQGFSSCNRNHMSHRLGRVQLFLEILEDRTVPAGPIIALGGSTGIEDVSQAQLFNWDANTPTLDFSNGFAYSSSLLTFNGTALIATGNPPSDGQVLNLTNPMNDNNGSAFSTLKTPASHFHSFFTFRITNRGGFPDSTGSVGGDGMAFVIQNVSSSIGSSGAGLGYGGIGKSVGVIFDTFKNTDPPYPNFNDPSSNFLGIDINGDLNVTGSTYTSFGTHTINVSPDFNDGNKWYVWVDYDGTNLEVRANETGVRPSVPLLSKALDIPTIIGSSSAYLGFTAATYGAYERHDVISWQYTNTELTALSVNVAKNGSTIYGPITTLSNAVGSFNFDSFGTGLFQINVTATDNFNNTTTATRSVTVVNPGVIVTPTTVTVAESGATDNYSVALNSPPQANVTISLTWDSQVTVTPTTLIFSPSNWNTPQPVTVSAVDDQIAQGNHNALITHTASSSYSPYNGISVSSVTANIIDNDVAGVTITPTSLNLISGNSGTYNVVLTSQPTGDVIITPNPDSKETVVPPTLTFTPANWNSPQTVTVTASGNLIGFGPFTGTITHNASSSGDTTGYNGIGISNVTVNIINPGVTITQSGGSTVVIAGGATDSYTAVLNSPPAADVTIALTPGSQVSVSPATLVFTSANWYKLQTVTVTGINPGSDTITHAATSSDSNYNGNSVTIVPVPVTILDKSGLIITGTPGNDNITVTPTADLSKLLVNVNGSITSVPLPLSSPQVVINAGDGNDTIQVNNPLVPIFVDAGLGTDSVTINGQSAANTFVLDNLTLTANSHIITLYALENLTINGLGSNDNFAVTTNPDPSIKNITLNGGLGSDILTGSDTNNTWKITGSNAGLLNNVIKFAGIENLTGGTGDDTFSFNPGKNITGKINGGGGTDVLDYSLFTTPLTFNLQTGSATGTGGIQNIVKILAGKSTNDKLIGSDTGGTWNISGKNAGNVGGVFFQNIENLTGGSGNDTFTFADAASLSGKLDGSTGAGDILDYSAYSTPISVNLQTKKATGINGGFTNIESFTGGVTANTLTAPNKTNTWTISGANPVSLLDGTTTYTFIAFANLVGGASSDTFNLTGSLNGPLNGGLGTDTLAEGDTAGHTWNITGLNTGTLDGQPFTGIENLTGGSGNDTFIFATGQKITGKINGGGGNNALNYSAFTTPVTINLATGKATNIGGILNLQQFLAGSNSSNILTAQNLHNTWDINATNAGTITSKDDSNNTFTYTFTGFQNLTGGSLDDNITLGANAAWDGYLQGGLGNDTLTGTGTWTTTTFNGHKFGSIENHP